MKVSQRLVTDPLHLGKIVISYMHIDKAGVTNTIEVTRVTTEKKKAPSNDPGMPHHIPHKCLYASNFKVLSSQKTAKGHLFN